MGRRSRERKARKRPPQPRGTPVLVNGQRWLVNPTPLTGVASCGIRSTRVARHTAEVFVLAPSWGAYAFGLLIASTGTLVGYASVAGVVNWVRTGFPATTRHDPGGLHLLFLGFAALLVWLGLRMLIGTTRFDKSNGQMTQRVLGRRTVRHPLADVVAVQCVYGGVKVAGGPRGSSWHEYQLNVLITKGIGTRVSVCGEPNGPWVRATAAALAAFLAVPLVDHYAATDAPCDRRVPPAAWRRLWAWVRGVR